ncbi:MAG: NAD-dependent epimerase/dehydratase family protein [Bacteroidetes bacterium]|nr:MAG: NAD-dependent epimerase/dehydratase family protein [Bacteroidota bacterium]REK06998.1 MAG: NAD-dependent epimerase/dehydratase family protein [Bacteroidota bacterium]REK33655.1 MAG: NAD-dependent epimerase/dehydratase family protein [Bacteroidota bacterium]REK48641.1 MAG: NAD-dependent epimerase/dehydratase family protein [Bacteroidota bacterium]
MNTSLVTGGAGFIGAHVTNELIAMGHRVVVLDDLSGGFRENVHPDALFTEGSITDEQLVEELFMQYKFDYVYHLAAYAAEGLSHFIKKFNYTNNLIGSVVLINAAVRHKVKCFVFTSSIAVYGSVPPPMSEETQPLPEDPYGIAKLAVEQDLKTTHEMFGLNYIIFRPHNVYGEYQNLGDRYRNVVGIFMNQLMQGKSLTVFGDGSQTRAFSYISDVAPHIARSVDVPDAYNQVFNVGADRQFTVKELADSTMKAMGIEGEIRFLPARNEVLHAHSDHSKIRKVFGTSDPVDLLTGLTRMAAWAKEAGIRKSSRFENIEITENLPQVWLED